jgi:catechol-2,3-dioxygenase
MRTVRRGRRRSPSCARAAFALHDPVERVATHSIHLRDPDGNLVELVFELPREQWEGDIDAALNTRRPPRPAG